MFSLPSSRVKPKDENSGSVRSLMSIELPPGIVRRTVLSVTAGSSKVSPIITEETGDPVEDAVDAVPYEVETSESGVEEGGD